jgi:uncharacterized protein (DUF2141 family)
MKNLGLFSFLLLLISCATVDVPPGGDKDTTPPKLISSNPDSAQLNTNTNTISLSFDEYFTLNNLNSNLIISPPLTYPFKSSIKGKNLTIKLNDTLKNNTTYQFYFGNSIADLTESNKTKDLRLVFSTGDQLDTSTLSGFVLDAFSQKPIENCKVLLYLENKDSQLLKQTPYYISLTDKTGRFSFSHIGDKSYYLYAIKDENNNNKLDVEEEVGFMKSSVKANTINHELLISTFLFEKPLEINTIKQLYVDVFALSLNQGLKQHIKPTISSAQSEKKNLSVDYKLNEKRDSIYLYLPHLNSDSLTLEITLDTLHRTIKHPIKKDLKQHAANITGPFSDIKPKETLLLSTYYPVLKTKSSAFILTDLIDSTRLDLDTLIKQDAFTLSIKANYKEGHDYLLELKENAIQFSNGQFPLTDSIHFSVINGSETGEIELRIDFTDSVNREGNFILHLVKEGQKEVLRTEIITGDTVVTYNYLKPAKYSAYIFEDVNGDMEWSSSNYLRNIKNEPIWRLKSSIEVRSKWKTKDISIKIK